MHKHTLHQYCAEWENIGNGIYIYVTNFYVRCHLITINQFESTNFESFYWKKAFKMKGLAKANVPLQLNLTAVLVFVWIYSELLAADFTRADSWFLKCVSRFPAWVAALCLWGLNAKTDYESAPLILRTSWKHSSHIDLSFRLHLETGVLHLTKNASITSLMPSVSHARMCLLVLFSEENLTVTIPEVLIGTNPWPWEWFLISCVLLKREVCYYVSIF